MSKVRSISCSFEGEELAMYAATGGEPTGAAAGQGVGLVAALKHVTAEHLLKHRPHSPRYLQEVMLLAGPMQDAAAPFEARLLAAEKRVSELEAFKAFVHRRLDTAGVPTHPDGPHSREGCRIGDRLDIVIGERDRVQERVRELQAGILALADEASQLDAEITKMRIERTSRDTDADRAMSDTPREMTREEVQDRFLAHVRGLIDYWEQEGRTLSLRGKLEGLAFTLLATLDGEQGTLPGFLVTPTSDAVDEAYYREQGENWYPADCDIAGNLHERFSRGEPKP